MSIRKYELLIQGRGHYAPTLHYFTRKLQEMVPGVETAFYVKIFAKVLQK